MLKSKLPNSQRVEKWIMEEVLPSIRQNGLYMTDNTINKALENPDFLIELATKLKLEKENNRLAQEKARSLENTIAINKPYTDFGKAVSESCGAITIGQFAKVLNNNNIKIGRNRLFSWFRENGYLIKNGDDKNVPKQIYINQGLFIVKERLVNTLEGQVVSTKTLITGKGQLQFFKEITF